MARAGRIALLGLGIALLAVALPSLAADDYTLGPGDVVSVTVYGHPDLSHEVAVLDDGTITYDIAGQITADGLTLDQLAAAIAQGLKQELREPQVTVAVKTPRPQMVRVGGAVRQPGNYDVRIAGRVVEAITAAGDLAVPVEFCRASILRDNKDAIAVDLVAALRLEPEANLPLQPEDVLYIADTRIGVSVNGQVARPGQYMLSENAGVREAIAAAGGSLPRADLLRSYIVRGGENLPVNVFEIVEKGAPDVALQTGDVVQIPESRARIAVFGYVNEPGYHEIRETDNPTIVDAIGIAGDLSRDYRDTRVTVMRMKDGQPTEIPVDFQALKTKGDLTQNIAIKPGDIIVVQGKRNKSTSDKFGWAYPAYLLRAVFGL
jgi:polysaccharide export outer membrane protein